MIEASRKTLELFIEKAEHLKYLAVSTNNFGGLIGIVRDSDQQRWRFHPELEGPLLTFRMFLQENERIGLYSRNSQGKRQRPKLLDLPSASDAWREKVEQAYNWIDKLLDAELPNLLYNGQPISRWKVLETFLYGDFAHTTPDKRETYEQWWQDQKLFGELMHEFMGTVQFMLGQILSVAEVSKQELALDEYLERHKE